MALQSGRKCDLFLVRLIKSPVLHKTLNVAGERANATRGLQFVRTAGTAVVSGRRFHQHTALVTSVDDSWVIARHNSTVTAKVKSDPDSEKFQVVIVGGGAGGCSVASKYARKLGPGKVAVIEPSETHYYQPMWTLVGAGLKQAQESARPTESVLPKNCSWIKDKVATFDPKNNSVTTADGKQIIYDYLVVAMGLQLNYHLIKGLPEAFDVDKRLCSNYWRETVEKTYPALQNFQGGNAIFTFPNTPIKCAGAPQKIMYLAEDFLRKEGRREKANILYNSSLGVIFGVKKYAEQLTRIVNERNIKVNFKRELVEVIPEKSEAVFRKLDSESGETETFKYDFMHIVPPMSAPDVLKKSPLVDETGYLKVNKETLQHLDYPNIFGIGDCTNVPTSKTAAAAVAQSGVLKKNLDAVMNGTDPYKKYDGYTSCPLLTSYGRCILAEFDFNGQPLETFPIDQGKERRTMWHLKKDLMPPLYWHMFLRGLWNGPGFYRKILNPRNSQ